MSITHFRYQAYGLNIDSPIRTHGVPESEGDHPLAHIHFGPTPTTLADEAVAGLRFQARQGECLFWVDGVARFYIRDGSEINVELAPGGDPAAAAYYLQGTALGALLFQRGLFAMHGSCVDFGQGATLLLGASGTGKSTLAAALCKRGAVLLSDDICLCTFEAGVCAVVPGFPLHYLARDSLEKIGLDPALFPEVRPGMGKRTVPAWSTFATEPRALRQIYLLSPEGGQDFRFAPIPVQHRLFALDKQVYRPQFAKALLGLRTYFDRLSKLAGLAPVTTAFRPRQGFRLEEWCDALIQNCSDTEPRSNA